MTARRKSILASFLATVREYDLLASGDAVLVAVSGGADSVCLLDMLQVVKRRFRLRLATFHLNHGLRESAQRDERFVGEICRQFGVELVVESVDVRSYARSQRLGIEDAGRRLRYARLEETAERLGCNRIALGHTADDNLETMLLNLVRGTGPAGLAGIPVCRGRFIRPLLDVERPAIEAHLRSRGLGWVNDESNQDAVYRRNRLRQAVVPILRELNPQAVANARRTARLLWDENRALDELAVAALPGLVRDDRAGLEIDTARLSSYNRALQRRIVKRLIPELDASAVDRLLEFVALGRSGRLTLTRGRTVKLAQGRLRFISKLGDSLQWPTSHHEVEF